MILPLHNHIVSIPSKNDVVFLFFFCKFSSPLIEFLAEYNQNVFGPQLPSIFLPEFQFRSDISKSDFTLIKKLGEGTFSNVYCCSWLKESNVLIALKVQSKEIIASKHAEKQIKRETNVHVSLIV